MILTSKNGFNGCSFEFIFFCPCLYVSIIELCRIMCWYLMKKTSAFLNCNCLCTFTLLIYQTTLLSFVPFLVHEVLHFKFLNILFSFSLNYNRLFQSSNIYFFQLINQSSKNSYYLLLRYKKSNTCHSIIANPILLTWW